MDGGSFNFSAVSVMNEKCLIRFAPEKNASVLRNRSRPSRSPRRTPSGCWRRTCCQSYKQVFSLSIS